MPVRYLRGADGRIAKPDGSCSPTVRSPRFPCVSTPSPYIDGAWRESEEGSILEPPHPASGEVTRRVAPDGTSDIDRSVTAAKRAFDSYSLTSPPERIELMERVLADFDRRVQYRQAIGRASSCEGVRDRSPGPSRSSSGSLDA